jgi:hypothetical protein
LHTKTTTVHKHDSDPTFDEGYAWPLETGKTTNLSKCFLVVQIWDDIGRLKRAKFLGGTAFSLEEVLTGETISGWYKLLSAPKAFTQNVMWTPEMERQHSSMTILQQSVKHADGGYFVRCSQFSRQIVVFLKTVLY